MTTYTKHHRKYQKSAKRKESRQRWIDKPGVREQLSLKRRLSRYGITEKDFVDMINKQQNQCSICNSKFESKSQICVDHDHTTGKVRGLLCHACNKMLGHAKDKASILENAIHYLEAHARG